MKIYIILLCKISTQIMNANSLKFCKLWCSLMKKITSIDFMKIICCFDITIKTYFTCKIIALNLKISIIWLKFVWKTFFRLKKWMSLKYLFYSFTRIISQNRKKKIIFLQSKWPFSPLYGQNIVNQLQSQQLFPTIHFW